MQYFSIDIETTGLNPETDQILQVGIAFEDTSNILPIDDIPKHQWNIKHNRIQGDPFAIQMNSDIIKHSLETPTPDDVIIECNIVNVIRTFTSECLGYDEGPYVHTITVAGKNFNGFDRLFLEKLDQFTDIIRMRRRTIDPAILCVDWSNNSLPDLQTCMSELDVSGDVTHTAMQDAVDVIRIIRKATNNYTL